MNDERRLKITIARSAAPALSVSYSRKRDSGASYSIDWLNQAAWDRLAGRGARRSVWSLANRESATSWKEFLLGLKRRGLRGVRLVVSGQPVGLRQAIAEVLTEAAWQRCYVQFLAQCARSSAT